MKQGQLVTVTHVAPWHGTDPVGAVLQTVGRVGVVDKQDTEGRYYVLFSDAVYVYQCKELEAVRECPKGWEAAD